MSTFMTIMGISFLVIAFAAAIGQIVKIAKSFLEYEDWYIKCANILTLIAILTVGVGSAIGLFNISNLLK